MVDLVDDDGVVVETVPAASAPKSLPRLQVSLAGPKGVADLRGTLAVLDGLPKGLRPRVTSIGADSPDGIWMRLSAPVTGQAKRTVLVQWGDQAQGAAKARVLGGLLRHRAGTYDVRAPDAPSTAS